MTKDAQAWFFSALKSRWAPLVFGLVVVFGLFLLHLPWISVDRDQENIYLGVPYDMFKSGNLQIFTGDPFTENGPQAVFLSAAVAYHFGLFALRLFHYLYSLVALVLFFWLFLKEVEIHRKLQRLELWVYSFTLFAAYWTIPLIFTYPVQTNGMTLGVICLLVGLLVLRKHPNWCAFAFGMAYSYKGQFLGLFPGLVLYWAFFDRREATWPRQLASFFLKSVIYFLPICVLIPALAGSLGLFRSWPDLFAFSWHGLQLWVGQVDNLFGRLLGFHTADDEFLRRLRSSIQRHEFSGFGPALRARIAFSILFFLTQVGIGFRFFASRPKLKSEPLVLLGMSGFLYWVNYLWFWSYPFFYNALVVAWFDALIIPFSAFAAHEVVIKRFGEKVGKAVLLSVLLVMLAFCANRLVGAEREFISLLKRVAPTGNVLQPYPFMQRP